MTENDLISLGFKKEEFIPGDYFFTQVMDYNYELTLAADPNTQYSGFRLLSCPASEADDDRFYVYIEAFETEFAFNDKTELKHLIRILSNNQLLWKT